ncbi:unnamed protein product [Lactuca saligna]|uniref:Uncharacterized protein n=1 Tax=Lactuca saligna TaxID=75948 RepID=A0AA35Z3B3_LACSI|nr:unnamed protein product [Lactuca saligna]
MPHSGDLVNEVDLDGNVVHLTSLDAPMETAEEHESKTTNQTNGNHFSEIESFRALAGDSDSNSLKEFIHKLNSNDEDGVIVTNTSIVLSPSSDKVHRIFMIFFKEKLKFLVTDAVDGPESSSKCILTCLLQIKSLVCLQPPLVPIHLIAQDRIFVGYNKSIRIFDIHRPGRDFQQHSTIQGNKEG